MTLTSEVLPGFDGFFEGELEPIFEIDFFLEEALVEVWNTDPTIPSTGGKSRDFKDAEFEDVLGAFGKI